MIKPFHEKVLKAIRAIDPDNLVSLGTPDWSGSPDKAYADPLKGEDLADVEYEAECGGSFRAAFHA